MGVAGAKARRTENRGASKQQPQTSRERMCAEALMMCDTFLARDFWTSFVHPSFADASELWTWGLDGPRKAVSEGFSDYRAMPTEVTALHGRRIHAVACGAFVTMAVVDDGELWVAGSCTSKHLVEASPTIWEFRRVESLAGPVAAVACAQNRLLFVLESGELLQTRIEKPAPEPVAALNGMRVVLVACNSRHAAAVLESGELFAWGRNFNGELGLGDIRDRIEPTRVETFKGKRVATVSCGNWHTAAVLDTGDLFTWGGNDRGQLGLGDRTTQRNAPEQVPFYRMPVKDVACGHNHTLTLLSNGEVFFWGQFFEEDLNFGGFAAPVVLPLQMRFIEGKRARLIRCGPSCSAVVLETGELFTWGTNFLRQIGHQQKGFFPSPTQVTAFAGKTVSSIAIGFAHSVALVRW